MSGETLVKWLQRVLVDAPDEWLGQHLIYEKGAGLLQALHDESELSIPSGSRIGHPLRGANLLGRLSRKRFARTFAADAGLR